MANGRNKPKPAVNVAETEPAKNMLSGRTILGSALIVALGAGAAAMFTSNPAVPSAASGAASDEIQVQQLAGDILNYKGAVDVRGVVARQSGPEGTFLVIDSREARICKSTGCATFYLPVKWDGPKPREWDEVRLHGTVTVGDRYPIFHADSIDKLGSIS